jgi:methionine-rich copper-binding protein CopC
VVSNTSEALASLTNVVAAQLVAQQTLAAEAENAVNTGADVSITSAQDVTDSIADKVDEVQVITTNHAPTGNVEITGTATQGQVLSASHSLADADGLGTIGYTWQMLNGTTWDDIPGATGATFTLTQAQVGHQVRAVASYTDGAGNAASSSAYSNLTSNIAGQVQNINDAPTLATPATVTFTDTPVPDTVEMLHNSATNRTGMLAGHDVDGDSLTYSIGGDGVVDDGTTYSKVGTYATLHVTNANGAYDVVPSVTAINALEDNATETFTVTVSDGTLLTSQLLTVHVAGTDEDTLAPTLSSSTPADNAIGVANSSNIVLTFSEAVQAGTGNIVISNGTDDIRTINVTDSQVTISGSTVTINPTNDLQAGSSYHVQIDNGAIKDMAGNGYAGISNTAALDFTTNSAPITTTGLFANQTTYSADSSPESVTTGDVDKDGDLDLLVADYASNTVSVLTGNGDGTFNAQVTYAVGSYPVSVMTGDVNGDNRLDLLVGNNVSNTVSVLTGNGDGTFNPRVTYATGVYPQSITIGDVNDDSKIDLIVANQGSNSISKSIMNS